MTVTPASSPWSGFMAMIHLSCGTSYRSGPGESSRRSNLFSAMGQPEERKINPACDAGWKHSDRWRESPAAQSAQSANTSELQADLRTAPLLNRSYSWASLCYWSHEAIGTALQDSTIHWGCSGWRARVQPGDTEARTNQSTTGGGVYVQHTNTPKPIRDTCSGTCSGTCSSPSRTAWALSFCLNRKLICSCWRVRFFWQRQQTLFHLQSGLCRNCDDAGG